MCAKRGEMYCEISRKYWTKFIGSVVYVREGYAGNEQRVFSSLQEAVNSCPDFTTIVIQVEIRS